MATKKPEADVGDGLVDVAQAHFDQVNAQGFFGVSPDQTPRANYTLAGVSAGLPTPESARQQ